MSAQSTINAGRKCAGQKRRRDLVTGLHMPGSLCFEVYETPKHATSVRPWAGWKRRNGRSLRRRGTHQIHGTGSHELLQATLSETLVCTYDILLARHTVLQEEWRLTNAVAAVAITHGHLLSRRADAPAATAPSKAKSRNTSSTCGKCIHADVERPLYSKNIFQRLRLWVTSWLPFSSSSLNFASYPLISSSAGTLREGRCRWREARDLCSAVDSAPSSAPPLHLLLRTIVSPRRGVPWSRAISTSSLARSCRLMWYNTKTQMTRSIHHYRYLRHRNHPVIVDGEASTPAPRTGTAKRVIDEYEVVQQTIKIQHVIEIARRRVLAGGVTFVSQYDSTPEASTTWNPKIPSRMITKRTRLPMNTSAPISLDPGSARSHRGRLSVASSRTVLTGVKLPTSSPGGQRFIHLQDSRRSWVGK